MYIKSNIIKILCALFLVPMFLSSCSDDDLDIDSFEGLWVQEQITEDGQVMNLTEKEKNLKLLIEKNGVYRTYTTDGVTSVENAGVWSLTDDKWFDFSTDIWHIKAKPEMEKGVPKNGEWGSNHVLSRFTVLSINGDRMEVRMKTFLGEKQYSPLFAQRVERPQITFDNIDELVQEYKTLKTYIFTFKKSSNLQH